MEKQRQLERIEATLRLVYGCWPREAARDRGGVQGEIWRLNPIELEPGRLAIITTNKLLKRAKQLMEIRIFPNQELNWGITI